MAPKTPSEVSQMSMFGDLAPVANPAARKPAETGQVHNYMVNMDLLKMNPDQPRTHIDEDELAELRESIKQHGIIQPVVVKKDTDGKLLLVAGHRRYLAARSAGHKVIAAILTDGDPAEIALIENIQRSDLTAIEEAEAFEKLKAKKGYTLEEMSKAYGKSITSLSEVISLTRLPVDIKNICRSDSSISKRSLVKMARKPNEAEMIKAFSLFRMRDSKKEEASQSTSKQNKEKASIGTRYFSFVVQKFSEFNIEKLQRKQRERARQELEKLHVAIAEILVKLDS